MSREAVDPVSKGTAFCSVVAKHCLSKGEAKSLAKRGRGPALKCLPLPLLPTCRNPAPEAGRVSIKAFLLWCAVCWIVLLMLIGYAVRAVA